MSCSQIIKILILIFSVCSIVTTETTRNFTVQNFQSACDQVYIQKQVVLESINYPSNYPVNYRCSYLLKGPTCPTYFNIQLLDFDVEESVGCTKDRLEISDLDALCGSKNEIKNYFAEKGVLLLRFISDATNTGRGYRILITRMPCGVPNPESTTQTTVNIPEWRTTSDEVEYTTTPKIARMPNIKCCQNIYDRKYLILTSPNFPYSLNSPNDCTFEIHKNNPSVCRLRIHVQFFYLGQSSSCQNGYLEIDGKLICGCKSELKIISPFNYNSVKTLRFVSKGNLQQKSYSGFVLEIIQDDCPKRYVPESKSNNFSRDFKFYEDQSNRVVWPKTTIDKLHLISEKTEIIDDDSAELNTRSKPQIFRHIYVFGDPESRDREETTYVDTSNSNSVIGVNTDDNYCINWNNYQFNFVSRMNLEKCPSNQNTISPSNCMELSYLRGYFQSPGYPFYYPSNLNICYRLRKMPGYCAMKIYMNDFNMENSLNCEKDYLSFNNRHRYCGDQITRTYGTLDMTKKLFEDINFRTDQFYCGRGFYATYEQIPCQDTIYPNDPMPTPNIPPYIPPPNIPDLPPNNRPTISCDRQIQERLFTLDIFDYNNPTCTFIIRKNSPDICKIRLDFEKFDLTCASESIIINGRMYCGHMTGQSEIIDMETSGSTIITYRKISDYNVQGLRVRIRGRQIDENCPYPEVPAERISQRMLEGNDESQSPKGYMVKFNKNFKDVCGIITNSTEIDLPETFCNLIERNDLNITQCLPLTENSLIVPLETGKIELPIKKVEKIEEIKFEVVDCEMLNQH